MELQEKKKQKGKRGRRITLAKSFSLDLISEILLRLPEKSVGRFRCVSKLWLSITTDPYFINLFRVRSPHPSLLVCFRKDDNLFVSSIPQHTHSLHPKSSENSYPSSQPTDRYHMKLQEEFSYLLPPTETVHGLICFQGSVTPIVWNPNKRQFLTLPKPRKSWERISVFWDMIQSKANTK
ncbi:unnamed protein product [Microthlaspi erraticum]|uniref:F-box domain-containing protein n=1 Tax=Microthlaspi erraticum TaxID=1685480 RepID=A0A6D2JVE1_9BRAS|nr:unnamed protein product [Microthlaspi erraticum]